VLREIRKDVPRFCGKQLALTVSPRVAETLLGPARKATQALGEELGRAIEIRARAGLHQEQFEVISLDAGPPVDLTLRWLADREQPEPQAEPAAAAEPEEVALAEAAGGAVEGAEVETPASAVREAARAESRAGQEFPEGDEPDAEAGTPPPRAAAERPAPAVDARGESSILPRFPNSEES